MLYKIKLREDIAKSDSNGIGFEYEVHAIPNNDDRVLVCFEDNNGNWIQLRYIKSEVEKLIDIGEWIIV